MAQKNDIHGIIPVVIFCEIFIVLIKTIQFLKRIFVKTHVKLIRHIQLMRCSTIFNNIN